MVKRNSAMQSYSYYPTSTQAFLEAGLEKLLLQIDHKVQQHTNNSDNSISECLPELASMDMDTDSSQNPLSYLEPDALAQPLLGSEVYDTPSTFDTKLEIEVGDDLTSLLNIDLSSLQALGQHVYNEYNHPKDQMYFDPATNEFLGPLPFLQEALRGGAFVSNPHGPEVLSPFSAVGQDGAGAYSPTLDFFEASPPALPWFDMEASSSMQEILTPTLLGEWPILPYATPLPSSETMWPGHLDVESLHVTPRESMEQEDSSYESSSDSLEEPLKYTARAPSNESKSLHLQVQPTQQPSRSKPKPASSAPKKEPSTVKDSINKPKKRGRPPAPPQLGPDSSYYQDPITEEIVCKYCPLRFAAVRLGRRHFATHDFKDGLHRLECVNCGAGLSRMDSLQRHMRCESKGDCLEVGLYRVFDKHRNVVAVKEVKESWKEAKMK